MNFFSVLIPDTADFDPGATILANYIQDDVHWNSSGHALIAKTFLDWFHARR
jgi:hypothetical protein